MHGMKKIKRATCIKGLFWHLLEPKTENCFSPISFDWFIRRITEVQNLGIYLNLTIAMVTKMADKIGFKQRTKFKVKIHTFFICIYYKIYSMAGIIPHQMFVTALQLACN